MIILSNGVKLAKNDKECIDSLFTSKTATCFYKRSKHGVYLSDFSGVFAFVFLMENKHPSIVNCSKHEKGYFYQYGLSDIYYNRLGLDANNYKGLEQIAIEILNSKG
jgi:hypothetical protein